MIFGLVCFGVCLVLGAVPLCKISGSWSHIYLKSLDCHRVDDVEQ